MKNKIILTIILGIFLISMASTSLDSLGTFKQNDCINISQTCATCTYVNISSISSNKNSNLISNVEMIYFGNGEWRYEFCNTSDLGRYDVKGMADINGVNASFAVYFEITASGECSQSTSQGISSAIYLVLMLVLMFTFGILGFRLFKTENLWVAGVFSMFLSVLLLVYNTWLGYEYHRILTGLPDSSIPETIFYIFLLMLVLGLLVSLALLFLNWKKVFKYIKNEIKRKQEDSKEVEDWDFDEWGGHGPYGN